MVSLIESTTLRAWLGDGAEIALIDVRDGGPFSRSHLLLASNIPLAQLEVRIPALLPRRDARLVLVDDGDGMCERAAFKLSSHGYTGLHILSGGVAAWLTAGYELFSGTNVPSKAFGELVEHAHDTPRIEPQELRLWQEEVATSSWWMRARWRSIEWPAFLEPPIARVPNWCCASLVC